MPADDDFLVLLDPRHPWCGRTIDVYPTNGATTYTEGRVRFTSHESESVRTAIADLRVALAEVRNASR